MILNTLIAETDFLPVGNCVTATQAPYYKQIARLLLIVADVAMVLLAFALAFFLRFHAGFTVAPEIAPALATYMGLVAVLIPIWLGLFAVMRLYDFHHLLGGTSEYVRVLQASTFGMMFVIVFSFMVPEFQIARGWLIMAWLLSALLVSSSRLVLRRVAYRLRHQGYFVTPALIVGTNREAVTLAAQLCDSFSSGLAILGFIDENDGVNTGAQAYLHGLPILGTLQNLPDVVRANEIEEVIVATTALTRDQHIQLPERLSGTPTVEMRLSSGLYEVFTTGMKVTTKGSVPLMSVNRLRLDPMETVMKTVLDYALVGLSSLALVPLFVTLGILIKLDSPGPIFHRRRVMGVGGKEFDAFKFRTMVVNGDEVLAQYPELQAELAANHKLKDDPRITRVGAWLRRTSLDELPQLLNVLLGQMSLVGPRMISPEEALKYGDMRLNLLTVKPGLTGLWQVSGRSDLSYNERVRLDMYYIRNYSIWMDLQILFFQTLPVVLKGKGAY